MNHVQLPNSSLLAHPVQNLPSTKKGQIGLQYRGAIESAKYSMPARGTAQALLFCHAHPFLPLQDGREQAAVRMKLLCYSF
eukprot:3901986-Amphidinium_carterae.1